MPNRASLEKFKRNRGYVLILAVIVATLVETLVHWHGPPDVGFMSIIAASLYLLYEGGLYVARFFVKR